MSRKPPAMVRRFRRPPVIARPPACGVRLAVDPGAKPGFAIMQGILCLLTFRTLDHARHWIGTVGQIVIERPGIRRGPGGKVDPRSIVTLALTAGEIAGRLGEMNPGIPIYWIPPDVWKGQVEKGVMLNRIRRLYPIAATATDDETDAIGLGAWAAGVDWIRGFPTRPVTV